MKTRHFWGALALLLCSFSFIGCSNDDEEEGKKVTDYKELVLTVASKKIPGIIMGGNSVVSELYAVKKNRQTNGLPMEVSRALNTKKAMNIRLR